MNAVVAYAALAAIYLGGMRLSAGPSFSVLGETFTTRPPLVEFVIQVFGIVGIRAALIWGVVGVAWSAVRTLRGLNDATPAANLLSIGALLLLVAAMLLDVRRFVG